MLAKMYMFTFHLIIKYYDILKHKFWDKFKDQGMKYYKKEILEPYTDKINNDHDWEWLYLALRIWWHGFNAK